MSNSTEYIVLDPKTYDWWNCAVCAAGRLAVQRGHRNAAPGLAWGRNGEEHAQYTRLSLAAAYAHQAAGVEPMTRKRGDQWPVDADLCDALNRECRLIGWDVVYVPGDAVCSLADAPAVAHVEALA